jgi:hypothetical protein
VLPRTTASLLTERAHRQSRSSTFSCNRSK